MLFLRSFIWRYLQTGNYKNIFHASFKKSNYTPNNGPLIHSTSQTNVFYNKRKISKKHLPLLEMLYHERRPAPHAMAHANPDHPVPDRRVSKAFSNNLISLIRTTYSIMKLFSFFCHYACVMIFLSVIKHRCRRFDFGHSCKTLILLTTRSLALSLSYFKSTIFFTRVRT